MQRGSVAATVVALSSMALVAAASDPAAGLKTPDDLAVSLVAAEPLLSSPSDIDVDARGRIWVCEVTNYRGRKDTRPEGDRILVLEDTDGDGRADTQTVFHQGRDVDSALGICVIGEGPGRKVIVSVAPDVFVFHDDDGDLKADRRESLFTKTGAPQHDHSVHAFVVGPDGRWYFNFGNTGQAVHDKDGRPVIDRAGNEVNDRGHPYRQGMVFRCRPDGSDFEVLAHNFRNNYEVAVDSFGGLWQSDNDDDGNRGVRITWVMEHGNFGYVDERTGAGWQTPRVNLEADSPLRHWHQNDPGVVPNLLLTGAGSPTGICVYEGSLLPERLRGELVHCDAGPRVVRAYPVKPHGAGYTATSETLLDGDGEKWFRPSDVCVAPDGSLIVADWHDPGVGGHGMGDVEKGRIFRIAPRDAAWSVPKVSFESVVDAVAALSSPNLCARATALERLAREPDAAAAALATAFTTTTEPRLRARLAWAAGMLPGHAATWIARLAADGDADLRVVALRMNRLVKGDVVGLAQLLAGDTSPAVRREVAISLHGVAGERADRIWAALASRHPAGDRFDLEALGIGADGTQGVGGPNHWDARLAAWRARVGDGWRAPSGREIIWRSRATETPALLCALLADPSTTAPESLALVRALDFQNRDRTAAEVRALVKGFPADAEKRRAVLPELVRWLEPVDAQDPEIASRLADAARAVAGSQRFVEIVGRFGLADFMPEVLTLAADEHTPDQLAAAAAGLAVERAADRVLAAAMPGDAPASRLLAAVGMRGTPASLDLLNGLLVAADAGPEVRVAAVRGLSRSQAGGMKLVELAKADMLSGPLPQVAALAVASCPWGDVRQAAAGVLPMPKAKGGGELPPVAELVKRSGDVARGREVFAGAGTCAKCHVVGGEGRNVGPNLSGIGAKLSREGLYEAILAPSAAISHSYESYTAVLADGRSVTGLLVSKSPESVMIRGSDGLDQSLAAADVEELVRQPVSLMPADLATTLSADELVDLVGWLETLKQTN